jgi:hypothetical protein
MKSLDAMMMVPDRMQRFDALFPACRRYLPANQP